MFRTRMWFSPVQVIHISRGRELVESEDSSVIFNFTRKSSVRTSGQTLLRD